MLIYDLMLLVLIKQYPRMNWGNTRSIGFCCTCPTMVLWFRYLESKL